YLDDVASMDTESLVITTLNGLKADPHLPDDNLRLAVNMVEATDDSFIFAKSISQTFCLHMERFQFAYGWLTNWGKTFAYILNDVDPATPDKISMPSVTIQPGVDPLTVSYHDVPVIRTGLVFLNAKVDDPGVRFNEMKDIIDVFAFPRLTGRLPITLLRKMVAQNIVSRCRALMSLQPIKQVDAEALDARVSGKIHAILGMPFSPSSRILTLPVALHGLGFPSLARINAGILWASDGSMIPASASLGDRHTVTAAVTGPLTLILQLRDRNLSILHGELMGHVLGLILSDDPRHLVHVPRFYSDHQNSVDLVADIMSDSCQESRLRGMNGRSLYRWILQLVREKRAVLTYTRGHSAELTVPSQMNREADYYASKSQRHLDLVPLAPVPTFTMDTYTLFHDADGWIESNTRSFVDHFLASEMARKLALGNCQEPFPADR
ncbi:hypothetical protein C8R43DRAFT_907686, partial [Mycena crocata]